MHGHRFPVRFMRTRSDVGNIERLTSRPELFGRQYLFVITFAALSAFSAGAAGSQNIQTLVILRFFGGCFGASPFTNAGGVIADMFPARQRGLAMSFFGTSVFLGPSVG